MTKTPAPMPPEPSEAAWRFLARLVKDRRDFIGLSQEDLVQYGGPGKSTVSKIERAAQPGYPARTQQQLEKALGWDRGTVREILKHADADYFDNMADEIAADYTEMELPDLTGSQAQVRSASDLTDEELVSELAYRMRRYALEKVGTDRGASAEKTDEQSGLPVATDVEQIEFDPDARP